MTTKLIQKHLLKGRQEFEIVDDQVKVRIKVPFKPEERLSVVLTVLNPEPVIDSTYLHFNSRVNGEPLLSLFLGKPNTEKFNAFVNVLKEKAQQEYSMFAGFNPDSQTAGLAGNVDAPPPEFEDVDTSSTPHSMPQVKAAEIDSAIMMLETYLEGEEIESLVSALKAIKAEPQDVSCLAQLGSAFNESGAKQGAVLTYAPYISALLFDDPYGDR